MASPIRVMKFGGTSVGDAARIRSVAEIIQREAQQSQVVAVVSAMAGVTNTLIEAAHESAAGDSAAAGRLAEAILQRHTTAIAELIGDRDRREHLLQEVRSLVEQTANLCRGAFLLRELPPRAWDSIAGIGERLSARIVTGCLREAGVPCAAVEATGCIVTDDTHGGAQVLAPETRERTRTRLLALLEKGIVPVVTGFIAATQKGAPTTLGRGGSDYSATILGAALDAEEVIIWTDVDGVLTADPRLVPEAVILPEVSYTEAAELAHFGAKVLHPKTLWPVARRGIPVWIRNSFAPKHPGTKISGATPGNGRGAKAVTAIPEVSLITVGGPAMVGISGILARTFSATATANANILMISQSSAQEDICLAIPSAETARTMKFLRQALAAEIRQQNLEHIRVDPNVSIVAVVGDNMRGTPGIAGRLFAALGRESINIIAIAQGSSESNISFLVNKNTMRHAVACIHQQLELAAREEQAEHAVIPGRSHSANPTG